MDEELLYIEEKNETLIKVNRRLEEVSRSKSDQSLNRDINTSRSENPAYSSHLGAESDTKVENKILKSNYLLDNLAKFIKDFDPDGINAKNFNKKLINAIGVKNRNQLSDYFTFDTPVGKVSLRLSPHHAHARTYRGKANKADKNISLVITVQELDKGKFKADKRVELIEFVYDSPNQERLLNIAKGIFNLVDTGSYVDLADADMICNSPAPPTESTW